MDTCLERVGLREKRLHRRVVRCAQLRAAGKPQDARGAADRRLDRHRLQRYALVHALASDAQFARPAAHLHPPARRAAPVVVERLELDH